MTGPTPHQLLVITASNGENLKLAQRFIAAAKARQCSASLVDLTQIELPLFNPRLAQDAAPAALDGLRTQMHHSPRWVICAPEYNGGAPPTLINAITWLSTRWKDFRALFNGQPVALATSSGGGGEYVITAMRNQFLFLGCDVVGRSTIEKGGEDARQESLEDVASRLLKLC